MSEEKEIDELGDEIAMDFTTTHEYIVSACYVLNSLAEVDANLFSKNELATLQDSKWKALQIIHSCINELYLEIFPEIEE
jgi:hypothetical protein